MSMSIRQSSPESRRFATAPGQRDHHRAPVVLPRLDVVVDRDPDNDTDVHVFVDGAPYDGALVHVLDPGRSGGDHAWWDSVTTHDQDLPQAVRDKIEEIAALYHDPAHCNVRCD